MAALFVSRLWQTSATPGPSGPHLHLLPVAAAAASCCWCVLLRVLELRCGVDDLNSTAAWRPNLDGAVHTAGQQEGLGGTAGTRTGRPRQYISRRHANVAIRSPACMPQLADAAIRSPAWSGCSNYIIEMGCKDGQGCKEGSCMHTALSAGRTCWGTEGWCVLARACCCSMRLTSPHIMMLVMALLCALATVCTHVPLARSQTCSDSRQQCQQQQRSSHNKPQDVKHELCALHMALHMQGRMTPSLQRTAASQQHIDTHGNCNLDTCNHQAMPEAVFTNSMLRSATPPP